MTFEFVTVGRFLCKYGSRQVRNSRKKLECIAHHDTNGFRLLKLSLVKSIFMIIAYRRSSEPRGHHQSLFLVIYQIFGQLNVSLATYHISHASRNIIWHNHDGSCIKQAICTVFCNKTVRIIWWCFKYLIIEHIDIILSLVDCTCK